MKLFKNNFHHHNRVDKISFKLNIEREVVEEVLDIMYGYVREKFDSVDIDKNTMLTEEEFKKEFPVVCIPSLGYFVPSYGKYKNIIKHKLKKNARKQSQQESDDSQS